MIAAPHAHQNIHLFLPDESSQTGQFLFAAFSGEAFNEQRVPGYVDAALGKNLLVRRG